LSHLLQIEEVSKIYPATKPENSLKALSEVSFGLEAGKALGIVGESGAGKSTLVRIIMGLERPTSGRVRFENQPISLWPDHRRQGLKKDIQLIWQDPVSFLNPFMTVEQLIAEPLIVFRLGNRKERRDRVRELAVLAGLDETVLNKRPPQLSGGQAQRTAIARSLSLNPKLLLCDEILTGLDSPRKGQILELLKTLQQQTGLAVLLVSHDLAAVAYFCARLVVMQEGRIVEEADVNEFLKNPKHPYSGRLLKVTTKTNVESAGGGTY
jgi:ABC-type glutathione transport system ATPase component